MKQAKLNILKYKWMIWKKNTTNIGTTGKYIIELKEKNFWHNIEKLSTHVSSSVLPPVLPYYLSN